MTLSVPRPTGGMRKDYPQEGRLSRLLKDVSTGKGNGDTKYKWLRAVEPSAPADARGRGWTKFKLYPEDHVKLTRIINREVTTPNSFRKVTLARVLEDWRGGGLTKW